MNIFIKICGITNPDDAFAASNLGADALGFIFHRESPRYIEPEKAAAIISRLPASVQPVGVFVNRPRSEIERIIELTGIKVVQLHGDEPPDDCRYPSVRVWKVFRPRPGSEIQIPGSYSVDAFLFDSFDETRYGGTGKIGNWAVARIAAKQYKVILSGGLNPDNIQQAITAVQPFGVDINSGVELKPGRKDKQKLEKIFTIIHNHQDMVKE